MGRVLYPLIMVRMKKKFTTMWAIGALTLSLWYLIALS